MLTAGTKLVAYHNLNLAFGDVFGDAGDNLCGLVDGEAVIVLFWNEMFCARSALNAGRWSLVAGRWSRKIVGAGL